MGYLKLDLETGVFSIIPQQNTREYGKAFETDRILNLNIRSTILEARKNHTTIYFNALQKYVNVSQSADFTLLTASISPFDGEVINTSNDFEVERDKLKTNLKNYILLQSHPTVWKEFIRQRTNYPSINALFQAAPEALTW